MTRQRRTFTDEFKRDAVALVTEQGYSQTDAAKSLGVNPNLIGRWKNELAKTASESSLESAEKQELLRLRKRVRELEMEQEILKKASAFFAKEMK